tara:strand:- start:702 stop:1823 length:1122 start_codon:yes stop_codon:yes gene_type:complete
MPIESHITAYISPAAVTHNLVQIRQHVGPGVKLCAVVKADAYGHGLSNIIDAVANGSDMLAVATPDEAFAARELGYKGPILVFLPLAGLQGRERLIQAVRSDITFTVTSLRDLEKITDAAHAADCSAQIHIKIDTGMNRLGIAPHDTEALLNTAAHDPAIHLRGLFTHFSCADKQDKSTTHEQLHRFLDIAKPYRSTDISIHAANSAATVDLPETHLDMVRCGIAIYGYQPSDFMHHRLDLRPAMRISAPIMELKTVTAGQRCGYGLTHTFDREGRIAAIPIGYADGFPRSLSNRAVLRINDRPTPVVGTISMDQLTIDVSDVASASIGDRVEIVSDDPNAPNCIENLARLADTIPYELTCRLRSTRVRQERV